MKRRLVILVLAVWVIMPIAIGSLASAQETVDDQPTDQQSLDLKQEIDQLNNQVKDKQGSVKQLESVIGNYQSKIAEQENAKLSLENEMAILENRAKEKQLAVERAKAQIEMTNLEIQAISDQIRIDEGVIKRRQEALADLVQRVREGDSISVLDAFLVRPSLSELFAHLEELKRVEEDLSDATQSLKNSKVKLEGNKADLEARRLALEDDKRNLIKEQKDLETNRSAKIALIAETQNHEEEFQRIIYELRQQRQSETAEISALENSLKDKLDAADDALARGDILLYWPIPTTKGITARFHDPSYPFRKLFEHPGVDVAVDVGTPVRAAAGGYVAWNRTGKQYGNYIMVIHAGGIATVYGHLSKFAAKPDTYVERGQIIGYSGGRPGDQGAGLSTGPHLHFEVRQNGIPVNPENFLPNLD